MLKLIGGRLYQWDLGRKLEVHDLPDGTQITEVDFCHPGDAEALVFIPDRSEGIATVDIPNILLQSDAEIAIYACVGDVTVYHTRKSVFQRERPADYVYTETQVLTYRALEERIAKLEQGGEPGQVLTVMKDGSVAYNYPAVIDATILPSYRYQQNQIAQVIDIILDSPLVGTFMLPSKTTTVRIYDTKIGEPHRLSNIAVGTPLQINVRGVNENSVFFYCYYANGNIDRYDYSVSDNKITTYAYRMLPRFTDDDNGKLLSVVNGNAAWITIANGNEVSY